MNYLLDTHVFLWTILDTDKLSKKAYAIIENNENTIFVSAVSFWEISLKYALGKINLVGVTPNDLINQGLSLGFELMPLSAGTATNYHKLEPNFHKDPFDRMLIWQAIQNNFVLISKDENVAKYQSAGLKLIW